MLNITQEQIDFYQREGYLKLENVLPEEVKRRILIGYEDITVNRTQ